MNFTNLSSLANIRCTLSLHPYEIILQFLLAGWVSPMFHHWPTSDVLFLLIEMISFYNWSEDDEFHQCFIVDQHLMYSFSSSRWGHFRISLSRMNFTNVSSLTNIRCAFCAHPNEIILQFLLRWWISPMFYQWRASDVVFVFIQMRSFYNLSYDKEFHQCFIIDQRWMYFFSSSRWDHFTISLITMNFTNVSSLSKVRCTFCLHRDAIILELLLAGWISPMFHHSAISEVLFLFIHMRAF